MTIFLTNIWPIENPSLYKVHFARWNGSHHPLDVFVRDRQEWQAWQEYYPGRDEFNRPHIFSLMQFYHEPDIWMFGGVFNVLHRHADRYEAGLSEVGRSMIGRLKLRSRYRERATRVNFENHYKTFVVQEILPELYVGKRFPGYDNIDLSFEELESLIKSSRSDWMDALPLCHDRCPPV